MFLDVIQWIVLGLLAGFLASKIVNRRGESILLDVGLGLFGAVIGGWIFRAMGTAGATGFNLWSLVVALIGSVILLLLGHAVRRSFVRA